VDSLPAASMPIGSCSIAKSLDGAVTNEPNNNPKINSNPNTNCQGYNAENLVTGILQNGDAELTLKLTLTLILT